MTSTATNSDPHTPLLRLLNTIRTDPRPKSCSEDALWSFYHPIRTAAVARSNERLEFRPHDSELRLVFTISDLIQALDAVVVYTPSDAGVETLRKQQLRNLLRLPTGQESIDLTGRKRLPDGIEVRYNHWCELVFVIQKGLMAAKTRAGSAASSLVSSPRWLELQTEFADPLVARLATDFTNLELNVPSAPPSSPVSAPTPPTRSGIFSRLRPAFRRNKAPQPPSTISGAADNISTTWDNTDDIDHTISANTDGLDHPSSNSSRTTIAGPGDFIKRDTSLIKLTKDRDHHRCILTGTDSIDAAHIIPYSCGNFDEYFGTHAYWQLLKILLGEPLAAAVWAYVGGENINRVENILCLSATAHRWLGVGQLVLVPHESVKNLAPSRRYLLLRYHTTVEFDALPTCYPVIADTKRVWKTYAEREGIGRKPRLLEDGEVAVCYTENGRSMPCPSPVLLKVAALMARLMWCVPMEQKKATLEKAEVGRGDDGDDGQERGSHAGPGVYDQHSRQGGRRRSANQSSSGKMKDASITGSYGQTTRPYIAPAYNTLLRCFTQHKQRILSRFRAEPESRSTHPTEPNHPYLHTPKHHAHHTGSTTTPTQQPDHPYPYTLKHHTHHIDLPTIDQLLIPFAHAQRQKLHIPSKDEMRRIKMVQRTCMGIEDLDDNEGEDEEQETRPEWVWRQMVGRWVDGGCE